jgi:TnpA family transposase
MFSEIVDWALIETCFLDMLRVVLSIKAGRISASTILRRLGTYSRKNRLYQAFSELGRVLRTGFLLRYVSDSELRSRP